MAVPSNVPRRPPLERVQARFSQRIRRLEVNGRQLPPSGVAMYSWSGSEAASDSWSPDLTSAVAAIDDTIGLTLDGSSVTIPPGWIFVGAVELELTAAEVPYTGDAYKWKVAVGSGVALAGADVITNDAPQLLGVAFDGDASITDTGLPVSLGAVESYLGTTFTPHEVIVAVAAIYLPGAGWPSSGSPT